MSQLPEVRVAPSKLHHAEVADEEEAEETQRRQVKKQREDRDGRGSGGDRRQRDGGSE